MTPSDLSTFPAMKGIKRSNPRMSEIRGEEEGERRGEEEAASDEEVEGD